MSPKARSLMMLYKKHMVTLEGLRKAYLDGVITEEEFSIITSDD